MDWTVRRTGRGWAALYEGESETHLVVAQGDDRITQTTVGENSVAEQIVRVRNDDFATWKRSRSDAGGALTQLSQRGPGGWRVGAGTFTVNGESVWSGGYGAGGSSGNPFVTHGVEQFDGDAGSSGVRQTRERTGSGGEIISKHKESPDGKSGSTETKLYDSSGKEKGTSSSRWSTTEGRDGTKRTTETGSSKGAFGDGTWEGRTEVRGDGSRHSELNQKNSDGSKVKIVEDVDETGHGTRTTTTTDKDGNKKQNQETITPPPAPAGEPIADNDPPTPEPPDDNAVDDPEGGGNERRREPTRVVDWSLLIGHTGAGPEPDEGDPERPAFDKRLAELQAAAARQIIGPTNDSGPGWGDAGSESPDMPDPKDLGIVVSTPASAGEDGWGNLYHPKALVAFAGDIERALVEARIEFRAAAVSGLEELPAVAELKLDSN